ncbi:hypothetical protein BASA81_009262 [Batrachochytrium salamandrivorans]|nr:hypothetical protein BASA81_009262 [Batrachochytrium salamandrivorans]
MNSAVMATTTDTTTGTTTGTTTDTTTDTTMALATAMQVVTLGELQQKHYPASRPTGPALPSANVSFDLDTLCSSMPNMPGCSIRNHALYYLHLADGTVKNLASWQMFVQKICQACEDVVAIQRCARLEVSSSNATTSLLSHICPPLNVPNNLYRRFALICI